MPEIFEQIAISIKNPSNSTNPKNDVEEEIVKYIESENRVELSTLRFSYDTLEHAPKNKGLNYNKVIELFNNFLNETSDNEKSVSSTLEEIKETYETNFRNIKLELDAINQNRRSKFEEALSGDKKDFETLLLIFDDKEMLDQIVNKLFNLTPDEFENELRRVLIDNPQKDLIDTIKNFLQDLVEQIKLLMQSNQEKSA